MAFSYDLTTDRGKVRLFIDDKDTVTVANQFFDDDEIDCFLTLAADLDGDTIRHAAAEALDTWATNQALVLKKVMLLDVNVDGPAVAKAMREHAALLREQAYMSSTDAGFEIAEMALGHFSWVEQVTNEAIEDV
jgi:hypothetical protein